MYREMAEVAQALAHPARITIIEHLIKQDACICTDLSEKIGLAQATISQHLKVLRKAGLIRGTISGSSMCYCIDPQRWIEVAEAFSAFFAKDPSKNCC
jgi:DNA-binding transcriptional ArsR family regulator